MTAAPAQLLGSTLGFVNHIVTIVIAFSARPSDVRSRERRGLTVLEPQASKTLGKGSVLSR